MKTGNIKKLSLIVLLVVVYLGAVGCVSLPDTHVENDYEGDILDINTVITDIEKKESAFYKWSKDNKFVVSVITRTPLIYDPYNILYGVEIEHVNLNENTFTSPINFWILYARAKPLESTEGNKRKLYGMYENWSYLLDHNIYRAFHDVTVSILYLGYNGILLGAKTKVFDDKNLFFLFKLGGGVDIEWFEGKILNSDSTENLGATWGFFGFAGGKIMLESFRLFDKKWYTSLGCDALYKIHQILSNTILFVYFGIGMEL